MSTDITGVYIVDELDFNKSSFLLSQKLSKCLILEINRWQLLILAFVNSKIKEEKCIRFDRYLL